MGNLIRSDTGKQIRTILVPMIVLAMAAKPSFADYFGYSDRAILDAGGTISRVVPNWRIVCFGEGRDVFGGVSRHKHCRIEKNDFRSIAVITSEGLSIPYRPSRPACMSYSGRMRVDDKPIGKLPLKAQIAVMSHGTTFSTLSDTLARMPKVNRIHRTLSIFCSAFLTQSAMEEIQVMGRHQVDTVFRH
jgi:hypothetical protein